MKNTSEVSPPVTFHNNHFSKHNLVAACLCLWIYSILLLRYWLSTITFSKFFTIFRFCRFFVEKTWQWIIRKTLYLFVVWCTIVTFGRTTPHIDKKCIFLWEELADLKNWRISVPPFLQGEQGVNQKVSIGGVYFWELGGVKRGRCSDLNG